MISIVIPTLNEAGRLPSFAAALAAEPTPHEVIVVDGGSSDGTAACARDLGFTVLETRRGRGRQLAAGANRAAGETLLFLHADSGFPAGGLGAIAGALAARLDAPGGNFRLVFEDPEATEFCSWLTGFYSFIRRHGLYYGDSGIFIRRAVYERIGGIKPLALMEDFDLVRRLERAGPTVCIETPVLLTSGRRFRGRGRLAIFGGWLRIHLLHLAGVSDERLARLYNSERWEPERQARG